MKTILEPLQQKELDYYLQKKHTAAQTIQKDYARNHGRVVCDSDIDQKAAGDFDVVDDFS